MHLRAFWRHHPPGETTGEDLGVGQARPSEALSVSRGRPYGSGYSDAEVEKAASDDGDARAQDKAVWGANALLSPFLRVLRAAHKVNEGLIGHDYRARAGDLAVKRERVGGKAGEAEQDTLDAMDTVPPLARQLAGVVRRAHAAGLELPADRSRWYLISLAVLVFGDLTLVAVTYETLSLSEDLVFGVPFTSPLDVAASSSVFAVLILAHFAGGEIRNVLNALARRDGKAVRARAVYVPLALATVLLAAAAAVVAGWSVVRAEFLAALGHGGEFVPFLLIQCGMLAAAVALSIGHAHPYRAPLRKVKKALKAAVAEVHSTYGAYMQLVAEFNGLSYRLEEAVAQAGHHVEISAADTDRQNALYIRGVQLGQPEAVTTPLFPKDLPVVETPKDLRASLQGIGKPVVVEMLSTDKVTQRRERLRQELSEIADHGLAASFGADADILANAERPPADAAKTNGGTKS